MDPDGFRPRFSIIIDGFFTLFEISSWLSKAHFQVEFSHLRYSSSSFLIVFQWGLDATQRRSSASL